MNFTIDRARSAERINADVQTLAAPRYTSSNTAICRYAYIEAFRNTLAYLTAAWRALGFTVYEDPIGNLVARNRAGGNSAFGVGSHCDSNRNGGKWDGTLGMACALEVCRLNLELGLDLPLQAIAFLEEEASGFGQMLLGSRIVAQLIDEVDLKQRIRAIDDGRPFWEHAVEAGYEPSRWKECARILDGLSGWIELHIEQARVLQDTGHRVGVVESIAGNAFGDVTIEGRADHAGGTPMSARKDTAVVAALTIAELERLAVSVGGGTVATVGEIEVDPGIINVVPGRTRISIDVRSPDDAAVAEVVAEATGFAAKTAADRGLRAIYSQRQSTKAAHMDPRIVDALQRATRTMDESPMTMISGAAHDTMSIAARVPSAMVFVPCKDGLSHTPLEDADPLDGAVGAEVMLRAIFDLTRS